MDWHPTDDDLVLQYYEELDAAESAAVADHLRDCPTCHASSEELRAALGLVSQSAVPEPSSEFEARVWAHVRARLHEPQPSSLGLPRRAFAIVGTLAAGLVAFATGFVWVHSHAVPAEAPAAVEATNVGDVSRGRERVLLTALSDHFSQTEVLLVELMNSPEADSTERDFERMTADDLVASGRLYRQTARQNGDAQFAQLLDDLEGVLVEVARSPRRLDRQDVQSLRTRIDSAGLLFKVRAVNSQMQTRQQMLLAQQ